MQEQVRAPFLGHLLAGQLVRYVISGSLALLAHVLTLVILVEFFATPPTLGSALGFVVAIFVNYGLQHHWVFKVKGSHHVYFPRYIAVTILTFITNIALFWSSYTLLGIWYPIAQVLTTSIIFMVNFAANRAYTFRD